MSSLTEQRVLEGLSRLAFAGHPVIWWSDPEGEFSELITSLPFAQGEVVPLDSVPALAIKRRIALDGAGKVFVLYERGPAPDPGNDWLLDIRLYAAPFAADATSMLQQDLGLRSASLRDHLKSRGRFFTSKERTAKLAARIQPEDTARDIDAKIWAVLARSPSADAFTLLLDLLCDVAAQGEGVPADDSPLWQELCRYGLNEFAWRLIEAQFGYRDESPSLARLVLRLFVTDLAHGMHAELPAGLSKLALPKARMAAVAVFLSQWRDSSTRQGLYDRLSARVASELKISSQLSGLTLDAIGVCATFVDLERIVANGLRDLLLGSQAQSVAADIRRIASGRMDGFWANTRCPDTEVGRRTVWRSYYMALLAATDLFAAIDAHARGFSFASAAEAYGAYTDTLYQIDQVYRQFHEAADNVSSRYPDAMAPLDAQVEARYGNSYLSKLAGHWDGHLKAGLLTEWKIPGIPSQQGFYNRVVAPYLSGGDDRRMFVIVSDALRYEVAEELKAQINGRERVEAKLFSQLGVLPSYTKLGMASLLPHKQLAYTDRGTVLVDGISSDGLENRSKILERVNGAAFKFEALANLGKQAVRDLVKPYRVVYVYHNTIDAMGDSSSTESHTWSACRQAIQDLGDLVGRLVNNANATAITITADHGFLFRESAPEALEKSAMGAKPTGTFVAKKRYLIGNALGDAEYAHHGRTSATAGTACDTEFWLPLGVGRFHFVGGARFVHGGASLQEVVVPVIEIRQKYKKSAESTRVSKVSVNVLGQQHRITTNRHIFTLLQTEAISERVLACSVNVGLANQTGEPVSSVALVRLDSTDPDMNQRQFKVPLSLLAQAVKKSDQHYLILSDAETEAELQRIPVRIDLAIENDFDF